MRDVLWPPPSQYGGFTQQAKAEYAGKLNSRPHNGQSHTQAETQKLHCEIRRFLQYHVKYKTDNFLSKALLPNFGSKGLGQVNTNNLKIYFMVFSTELHNTYYLLGSIYLMVENN
jgi:hypothetical protein